jgi:predicted transcriptional regulator
MATKKKKMAKKSAAKTAARKPAKRKAKNSTRKPVRAAKKPAKRKTPQNKVSAPKAAGGLHIKVNPALQARLSVLAKGMERTMDELLLQALTEFADTWEEHQRTVDALNAEDDRMQIVVPQAEP